jgi:hypothetical protein
VIRENRRTGPNKLPVWIDNTHCGRWIEVLLVWTTVQKKVMKRTAQVAVMVGRMLPQAQYREVIDRLGNRIETIYEELQESETDICRRPDLMRDLLCILCPYSRFALPYIVFSTGKIH